MSQQASTTYLAFESSEELYDKAVELIENIQKQEETPQAFLLVDVLIRFVDELLDAYFINLTQKLELNRAAEKIISITSTTISTSAHILIKKALGKLTNAEMFELSQYMESLIMERESNPSVAPFTAIPLSKPIAEHLLKLAEDVRQMPEKMALKRLQDFLYEVLEVAIERYYRIPIAMVNLGALSRRLANIGYETARRATHTVIKQVVTTFSYEQMVITVDYFEAMMVEGPVYQPSQAEKKQL